MKGCTVNIAGRAWPQLNKIDGVAAKVDLKKNRAIVSFDRPVEDETLRLAVEKVGFKVVSIG